MTDPRLKVFKHISDIVGSVIDIDNLFDVILVTATKIMNAKASSLLLKDELTGKLFFHIATGDKKEEVRRYELEKGEGLAGWVAENGQPILVTNVKEDPRWSSKIAEETSFETNSIACSPMKVDNRILGVIEIIDHEDGSVLDNNDGNAQRLQRTFRRSNIEGKGLFIRKKPGYPFEKGARPEIYNNRRQPHYEESHVRLRQGGAFKGNSDGYR